jgi:hypothetical protein
VIFAEGEGVPIIYSFKKETHPEEEIRDEIH